MPDEIVRLAERLQRERPVPAPGFRGELGRRLSRGALRPARPPRLGARIAAYAGAGSALLLVGALSTVGVGPLGA